MTAPSPPATLAYILKGYPRISETFISNEILLLEQLGFCLRLFPMRRPRENFCHDSVKQIKASVDYLPTELMRDMPKLIGPNIFCAAAHPRKYCSALALAAKRFRRTKRIATLKHLFQAGYLVQKHLARDASVVQLHGHFAHSPTSVTMFAAHLADLPFSFTAHAKDIYTSHPEQLREKIAQAEFVTTCTLANKHYLESILEFSATPIHCVYHGIDLSLFNNTRLRLEPKSPYRLLTIARITEKKGLPTVYRALKLLAERQVAFHHTLIGDGDDREQILGLIEELKLTHCCSWLGTRTHSEVLEHFRDSDLFVLGCEIAKNGDRDGIPNVLVESLAMGVPAVSTNVSALPEILINEKTGLTVEPQDSHGLAQAIELLLTDMGLRKSLIATGQQYVRSHFDSVKEIARLAELFRSANPLLQNPAA